VNRFSPVESEQLEKGGYLQCTVDLKLRIVKNLLESQFDENLKLRQRLVEKVSDLNTLRTLPLGRDTDNLLYYFFIDSQCTFRLFTQPLVDQNETSWTLVAKYGFYFIKRKKKRKI
jgi:remodeling and spacing factor 1